MKIKINRLKCKRCGHEWTPRGTEVRQCPRCKTAYWDKEKEGKENSDGNIKL